MNADLTRKEQYTGAGMIIFRSDMGMFRVLCLLGTESGSWGFPKGKKEAADNDIPALTAMRETREETGLIGGYDYIIKSLQVTVGHYKYSICTLTGDGYKKAIVLSPREHASSAWFSLDELLRVKKNADLSVWVKKMRKEEYYNDMMRLLLE